MSEIKLKKKRRWPIILAIILLLIGSIGAYAYHQGYLDPVLKACGIRIEGEEQEEAKNEETVQIPGKPVMDRKEDAADTAVSDPEENEETGKDPQKPEKPDSGSSTGGTDSQKKGHWETRYETIPAWDEQVLVKAGYYESVLVTDAWDEEDTYCYAYGYDQIEVEVCNTCGAQFQGGINQHLSETGHSGWHNEYVNVGEQHCLEYRTEYIHHDAVYKQVWHDPEYKTVHHPEETRSYQVWVDD